MPAQTVGALSILCMCVTLLVCFAVPIGLAVWARRKYGKAFSFLPLLAGVIGFTASQIVFRLPLTQVVLPMFGWYKAFMGMKWPYLIFMCFTAGLVEEPARFLAFIAMKKHRRLPDGISYGIGHGGIEAVYLVALAMVGNLYYSLMINTGAFDAMVDALRSGPAAVQSQIAQLGQVKEALVTNQSALYLVGGLERIFTAAIHIALSLVVLRGFVINRRALYLLLSILLHGFVNLIPYAVAQAFAGNGMFWMEAAVGVEAALAVWYIAHSLKRDRSGDAVDTAGEKAYEQR